MTYLDLVQSGILHGLVAVLPVGSMALVEWVGNLAGDPVARALIDALAIFGILPALFILLRHELGMLGMGVVRLARRRFDGTVRLLGLVLLAALPYLAVDLSGFKILILPMLVSCAIAAAVGIWFLLSDRLGVTVRDMHHLSAVNFLTIGVVQAGLAMVGIPALLVSIAVARLLGCERDQAAKLGLLLVIPHLVFVACSAMGMVPAAMRLPPMMDAVLIVGASFTSALLATSLMLAWVSRQNFLPFALFQVAGGIAFAVMLAF